MTNFEYYIKGGRRYEGYKAFFKSSSLGTTTATRIVDNYTEWLLEEHKKPILDDIEKEYISNIIKPFRDRVTSISKIEDDKFGSDSKVYYIDFQIDNGNDFCFLPSFEPSTGMYKNMEANHRYTLKELGL